MSNRTVNAAMLLAALAATAQAQTPPDTPVESVIVTGSYSPQPAITASSSVIDAAQIRLLNKRTVAGLLKTLPGVLVEEQGGPGGLTAVSIRGGESNFTLVLLDGVPVNDPTNTRGGGFDFADLDTATIDRIEVVRGAQSSIYGSDALAGVINIITRRPGAGHEQSVYLEGGEDDFYNLGAGVAGSSGAFDYRLELATRDDGDPVPGSERETDSANLRLGWALSDDHALSASYRYLDGQRTSYPEQSGGPEYAVTDDLDSGDYDEQVIALGWRAQLLDNWQSVLSASRFERNDDYRSPGIPPYLEVPPNAADTDFTRDEVRWVNTLAVGGYALNAGAEYRSEDGESDGDVEYFGFLNPTDFELDRDTAAVFVSASGTLLDRLLLQGSLRYDDPDDFDAETTWRAGANYGFDSGLSLFANWGEAFKLPSFFALGNALVGNPDLEPEKAEGWDAGIAWNGDNLGLEAAWFFNDFQDLVDFDDETFRNVNRQNVETSGVELQATWQAMPGLELAAQGTWTDIDVKDEDTVLTGRPEWTAGLLAQWRLAPAWDTVIDYRYTGEQWAASRHTGQEVTEELDDYHRVDWTLRWRATAAWQLQASVDNLLDEDYETAVGFPAPGRSLRIAVRYTH